MRLFKALRCRARRFCARRFCARLIPSKASAHTASTTTTTRRRARGKRSPNTAASVAPASRVYTDSIGATSSSSSSTDDVSDDDLAVTSPTITIASFNTAHFQMASSSSCGGIVKQVHHRDVDYIGREPPAQAHRHHHRHHCPRRHHDHDHDYLVSHNCRRYHHHPHPHNHDHLVSQIDHLPQPSADHVNSSWRSFSMALPRSSSHSTYIGSIVDILRSVNADLIALQNVKADEADHMRPLSELAHALHMYYAFAETWAPEFGHAVLSRWPIKASHGHRLLPDDVKCSDSRLLQVAVEVPCHGQLQLCTTQLDHLDEDCRLRQARSIIRVLGQASPHILAGDLNALDASDYSTSRWSDITKMRLAHGKLPPRQDVMTFLKQQQGYRDCKECWDGAILGDDYSPVVILPPGQEAEGTCKSGTRVDYILASPFLPYRFVPGSYRVVSSKGTSDHHIVQVKIEPAAS